MTLPTPLYDLKGFPDVYEPSEDSFLFLDALEAELGFLQQLKPSFIVEIGSGSGIIISAVASLFKNSAVCYAVDLNPQACHATHETAKLNLVSVEVLNMDLLDSFRKPFDVLLFNPPYVVTESSELAGNGLRRSWAGGSSGREVLDKVLLKLPSLLTKRGVCYVVILKENRPEDIVKMMNDVNIMSERVTERKIRGEHLFVYKFSHKNDLKNNHVSK